MTEQREKEAREILTDIISAYSKFPEFNDRLIMSMAILKAKRWLEGLPVIPSWPQEHK